MTDDHITHHGLKFHAQAYGLADLSLLPAEAVAALLGDRSDLARELSPVTHVDGNTAPSSPTR